MTKMLKWTIKRLVTLYWKLTRFNTYSWGIDENVDIHIISEESYVDRYRYGVREEIDELSRLIETELKQMKGENNGKA